MVSFQGIPIPKPWVIPYLSHQQVLPFLTRLAERGIGDLFAKEGVLAL